MDNIWDGNPL